MLHMRKIAYEYQIDCIHLAENLDPNTSYEKVYAFKQISINNLNNSNCQKRALLVSEKINHKENCIFSRKLDVKGKLIVNNKEYLDQDSFNLDYPELKNLVIISDNNSKQIEAELKLYINSDKFIRPFNLEKV